MAELIKSSGLSAAGPRGSIQIPGPAASRDHRVTRRPAALPAHSGREGVRAEDGPGGGGSGLTSSCSLPGGYLELQLTIMINSNRLLSTYSTPGAQLSAQHTLAHLIPFTFTTAL